jgi:alpha-tubulin suppressor-like RCC1 family protein
MLKSKILYIVCVSFVLMLALACGGGGGGASSTAVSVGETQVETQSQVTVAQTKMTIDLASFGVLEGRGKTSARSKASSSWRDVKKVKLTVSVDGNNLFKDIELLHLGGTLYEVILNNLPTEKNIKLDLRAVDAEGNVVVRAVTEKTIKKEDAGRSEAPSLSMPLRAVVEFEGKSFEPQEVEQIVAKIESEAKEVTPVVETPVTPVVEIPATPVVETPATPVVETPATPVVETPATPVVETPATPVVETPATPVVETPATPVVETPVTPVVETPVTPVVETPVTPVVETPVTPVVETPVTPVVETPATPVVETPVTPVVEAPVTPVVETPATPVVETPVTPVVETPATPVVEAPVTPVPEATVTFYNYESGPNGGMTTNNQQHGFLAHIQDGVLSVTPNGATNPINLKVHSYGRGLDEQVLGTPAELLSGNRFVQSWGNLQAYYENRTDGLEQVFIVDTQPAGSGNLFVNLNIEASEIKFQNNKIYLKTGSREIVYGKLKVFDATGTILAAHFEYSVNGLGIQVVDEGAIYPITIDPTLSAPATITILDQNTNGRVDAIRISYTENITANNSPAGDWTVLYAGAPMTKGVFSVSGQDLTIALTEGGIDTDATKFSLTYDNSGTGNVELTSALTIGDNISSPTILDGAPPVLVAVEFSKTAAPAGSDLSGRVVNSVKLTYSENVIVDSGSSPIAVNSGVDSRNALGSMATMKQLSNLISWNGASDMACNADSDNYVEHTTAPTITIYINAKGTGYFNSGSVAPTAGATVTSIASNIYVRSEDVDVAPLGTSVVATNPTAWDITPPSINAKVQFGTAVLGSVDTMVIGVNEAIYQPLVTPGSFTVHDTSGSSVASANTASSSTQFSLTVSRTGTESKYISNTLGAFRDIAGNRVAASANLGYATDSANPVLLTATYGTAAAPSGALAGKTVNTLTFGYSENLLISGITVGSNAASTATVGSTFTSSNTINGLIGGLTGDISAPNATGHTVELLSPGNLVKVYFNTSASSYYVNPTPTLGQPSAVSSASVVDANSNQVKTLATGVAVTGSTASWDLTLPTITSFYTLDSTDDGYINCGNVTLSKNVIDASATASNFAIDSDSTAGGNTSGLTVSTAITFPAPTNTADDTDLSFTFTRLAGTQSKYLNVSVGTLRDYAGNRLQTTTFGPSIDKAVPVLWQTKFSKLAAPAGTDLVNKKVNSIVLSYSENVNISFANSGSDDLAVAASLPSTATMGGLATIISNTLQGLVAWVGPAGYNMKNHAETDNQVELTSDNVITVYLNSKFDARFNEVTTFVGPDGTTVVTPINNASSLKDDVGFAVSATALPTVMLGSGATAWDTTRPTLNTVVSPAVGSLVTDYNLTSLSVAITFSENIYFSGNKELYHLSDNGIYRSLSSDNMEVATFTDTSPAGSYTSGTLTFGPASDRFKSGNIILKPDPLMRDEAGLPLNVSTSTPVYYYVQVSNVAHYPFLAGLGTDSITTAVTGNFDATLTSTTARTDINDWVVDGNAMMVNGGSLTVANLDRRNFPQPKGSLEFWYKTKATTSTTDVIFGDTLTTGGNYFSVRHTGSANTYKWAANGLGSANFITFDMAEKSWHHLALFYNDIGTTSMVVNGVSIGNTMTLTGFNPTDQDFIFASGNIDNVRLYDIVNSQTTVQNYFIPLVQASWPIDQTLDTSFASNIISDNTQDFDAYLSGNPTLATGHHESGNSLHLRATATGNMGFDATDFGEHLFPHHRSGSLYFWVRPNPTTSTATWLLDDEDSTRNHFVIQGGGNVGQYVWKVQKNDASTVASSTFMLQDHAWNHVGVTWEAAGNLILYVNGSANTIYDNSTSQWTPTQQIICSTPNGYLDEFHVIDSVLPATSFATEFNTWHTPSGNYSFDSLTSAFTQDDIGWSYILDDTSNHHRMYFSGASLPTLDIPHYGRTTGNSLHFGDNVGMQVYSLESDFFSSGNGTYSFWWKPDYKDNGTVEVLDTGSNGQRDHFVIQSSDNIGNFKVILVDKSGVITTGNTASFKPVMERWNHIALTWGNSVQNFYFNGNVHTPWTYANWHPVDQITASTPNGSLDELVVDTNLWTASDVANEYFGSIKNLNEIASAGTYSGTSHANIMYNFSQSDLVSSHTYAANLLGEHSASLTPRVNYGVYSKTYSSNSAHHDYVEDVDYGGTPVPTEPTDRAGSQEFGNGGSFWVPSLDRQRFPQAAGTIRFWYKPVQTYAGADVVFGGDFENTRTHQNFFRIVETATQGLYDFQVYGSGALVAGYTNIELHPNVFNYVTVSWTSGTITLFINGYEKYTNTGMGAWRPSDQLFVSTPNGTLDMMYLENVYRDENFIRNSYFLTYVTPAGFYDFESAGLNFQNDVNPLVNTGNHGSGSGVVASSAGYETPTASAALDLTAAGAYFEIPSLVKDLFPQNEGVVRMWVKPDPNGTFNSASCLFDIRDPSRNHFYMIPNGAPGFYRFGIQDTGTREDTFDFNISNTGWSHVAFNWSHDSNNVNLMVNGEVIYTTPLGSWYPEKQYATSTPAGYLDDVFISYLPESIHEVEDYYYTKRTEPVNSSIYSWGSGSFGKLGNDALASVTQPAINHHFINVKKVVEGDDFGIALLDNGMLQSWGRNHKGQLGDNTLVDKLAPVNIPLVNGVIDVDCGSDFAVAVLANGNVMAWGNNDQGQLGGATVSTYLAYPTLIPELTYGESVACGNAHVLVKRTNGDVYTWGNNDNGQCVVAGAPVYTIPGVSLGGVGASAVDVGLNHSAMLVGTTIYTYGSTANLQSNNGATSITNAVAIACGASHNVALINDGTVKCWGQGGYGQLGGNVTTDLADTAAVTVQDGNYATLSGVTGIAAGGDTSYALISDNTLRSWGDGSKDQLGNSINQSVVAGNVGVAANVMLLGKAGKDSMHAIFSKNAYYASFSIDRDVQYTFDNNDLKDSGTYNFHGWFNDSPTSGNGHSGNATVGKGQALKFVDEEYFTVPRLSGNAFPQDKGTVSLWFKPDSNTAASANVFGNGDSSLHQFLLQYNGSNAVTLSVHNVGAVPILVNPGVNPVATMTVTQDTWNYISFSWDTSVNSLVASCNGVSSTIGIFFSTWRPYQQVVFSKPDAWIDNISILSTATTAEEMVNSYENGLSLFSGDYVSAWGDNSVGQLQDGTTVSQLAPVLAKNLSGPADVGIGLYHAAVLLSNGVVKTIGTNAYGQLGNGSSASHYSLTSISLMNNGASVFANQLATGPGFNIVVLSNGNVMSWGSNYSGELGLNTSTVTYNSPQLVTGLVGKSITKLAVGSAHALVIADGDVWAWGRNDQGQLGIGTTTNSKSPARVTTTGDYVDISCGDSHSMALTSGGLVYVWGNNNEKQLGDGTVTDSKIPKIVSSLSGISKIAAGGFFSLAYGGTNLYGFGNNTYGQTTGTAIGNFVRIAVIANVSEISAGTWHGLLRLTDGTIYSWGNNAAGQLGQGNTTNLSTPTQVPGIINAIKVIARKDSSYVIGQ